MLHPKIQQPITFIGKINSQMVALFCGLFIAFLGNLLLVGQGQAEKELRSFLAETKLLGHVMYDSVSVNPLSGVINVKNISGYGKGDLFFVPKIGDFEVASYNEGEVLPRKIRIKLKDVKTNSLEIVRNKSVLSQNIVSQAAISHGVINKMRNYKPLAEGFSDIAEKFLLTGYVNITSDVDFLFEFNDRTSKAEFRLKIFMRKLGRLEIKASFADFTEKDAFAIKKAVLAVKNDFINGSFSESESFKTRVKKTLGRLKLDSFSVSYEDKGFAERFKQLVDSIGWKMPDETSLVEMTDVEIQQIVNDMVKHGLSIDLAENAVEAYADFVKEPRFIEMKTAIVMPVSVAMVIDGLFSYSLIDFTECMKKTNSAISTRHGIMSSISGKIQSLR